MLLRFTTSGQILTRGMFRSASSELFTSTQKEMTHFQHFGWKKLFSFIADLNDETDFLLGLRLYDGFNLCS